MNISEYEEHQHLVKLANAFFGHLQIDNCEFGGIGLDSKRPFGNSSVEYDILEIIGIKPENRVSEDDWEYSYPQKEYTRELYFDKLIPFLQKWWRATHREYHLKREP